MARYECIVCGHGGGDNRDVVAFNCDKCGGHQTMISVDFQRKSPVIIGDGLEALRKAKVDCIAHVCNNQQTMGSGFALQVRNDWPRAYLAYMNGSKQLGTISVDDRIFNLVAQDNFRRDESDKRRFLNYGALSECLMKVVEHMHLMDWNSIAFPYLVGSDRAGGDFKIVSELIQFHLRDFDVRFYKL